MHATAVLVVIMTCVCVACVHVRTNDVCLQNLELVEAVKSLA